MLGKSVLPRVLVRVTLLLPAHLPVLIGQRVSHSGGCRLVLWVSVFARAHVNTDQPPYTNLNLNKEFKSKSKWWWKVVLMLWVGKEGTDSFLP